MKNRPIANFVTDNYVVTYRGDIVENRHHVHAAVVDANGHMLYTVGNPSRLTLIRSAAKPAQALAVIEAGVFEEFDLDDADLALMCASHNSEDQHILRARTMLQKVRAEETDLRCGGHPALNDAVNKAWIKADYTPTGICNNCCGKHVGMIAGAKCLGAEVSDYHLPSNPMQKLVKHVVGEMTDIKEDEAVKWAIDGCNLPTPAIPLSALARMYASLAKAADLEKLDTAPQRTQHLARIFRAMTTYPELVGGDGRFCTRIMAAYNGILVGKLGADGCYGIGIRSTESTRKAGLNGPIGIAIKIEDGKIPILYSAVMEILEQLEIGTSEIREMLADFHRPKLSNTAGVEIGHVDCAFKLCAVE